MDSEPLPERFEILGRAVRLNEQSVVQPATERQLRFSNLAAQKLMSIPGHAEYFRGKAWDLYRKFKLSVEEGDSSYYEVPYIEEEGRALDTLALLPSPESFRMLGGMLDEGWKWPSLIAKEERGEIGYTFGMRALSSLSRMPIANPPSNPIPHTAWVRDNIGVWQQWYAEIESGHRTFRFIGDDTEYDLRGPVRRGGMNDRNRGMKRVGGLTHGNPAPGKANSPRKGFLPYILGGLFLVFAVFIYLRWKMNAH